MRKEKQLLIDEIVDQIEDANGFVVMSYEKIGANQNFDFRSSVREAGGNFMIVKKRVFAKALEGKDYSFNKDELPGHVALMLAGEDVVAATKAACDFAKGNKNLVEILGGLIEGSKCSSQDVVRISKLPGRDQMRSEFLGLLTAPMSQTLSVMDALLTSVPHCLENKANKEGE